MRLLLLFTLALCPSLAFAAASGEDLTQHWVGYTALVVFAIAYLLVMSEEVIKLRKSKPVLLAAGIIWVLIAFVYRGENQELVTEAFRHNLLEFAELMLFLLVAMTYINAMEERRLFDSLRAYLVSKQLTYRKLFWMTGILSFVISPIADNLTTALLMCAVVLQVAKGDRQFIALSCVNIVVAANAGGAFSPFGDITTLMVWQKGIVAFNEFFALMIPSVVNFIIPAAILSLKVSGKPVASHSDEVVEMKRGARRIVLLFLLTIATAVTMHSVMHLPPVLGMMTGLGYLQFFGFFLRKTLPGSLAKKRAYAIAAGDEERLKSLGNIVPFDVFNRVARAEWDTLLFFYGVVVCVGGLGFIGYLELTSTLFYQTWHPTYANIAVGVLSAIVDNIPVMFAVLTMEPSMSLGQWLLVTLTAGVGGSMLSIGSAAGVALMGQARGYYTFFGHLKWAPVIALGYLASIATHLVINQQLF